MKKFASLILSLLYLAASTGAAFSVHYCMGKLQSVDIVNTAKCSNCGMENEANGCCKDVLKVIKLKDSHQPGGYQMFLNPPVAVLNNYHIAAGIFNAVCSATVVNNNSPPPPPCSSICIFNCVFRI